MIKIKLRPFPSCICIPELNVLHNLQALRKSIIKLYKYEFSKKIGGTIPKVPTGISALVNVPPYKIKQGVRKSAVCIGKPEITLKSVCF